MFEDMVKRRKLAGLIVGGGLPCQPNSNLSLRRKGLEDERASTPRHVAKTRDDMMKLKLPILTFLENVAFVPSAVFDKDCEIFIALA